MSRKIRTILESAFAAAVLLMAVALSACGATDLLGREPDPVQVQAGLNANATPSSAPCDYKSLAGVSRRSGGPLFGSFGNEKNLGGIDAKTAASMGMPLTENGVAEWEAFYKPILVAEVQKGNISAPTAEAYHARYGCTFDAANPINRPNYGLQRVGAP